MMTGGAKWEGDNLVATTEFTQNGKTFKLREVSSEFTPGSFTQTLYQGETGTELQPIVILTANRVTTSVAKPTASH